jgi:hypothetical protein
MSFVLAALDTSNSARTVLDVARRVGLLTDTVVRAIHVRDSGEPVKVLESIADEAGVALRVVDGAAVPVLTDALREPEAIAAVIGGCARSLLADPRAWRVARAILENTNKPVVVAPCGTEPGGEIRRLLVPLEGSDVSSRSVLEQLVPLVVIDVELEVLHVFTAATVPAMLDQPTYDLDTLGREFLSRHFPHASSIEFRTGAVIEQVARVSFEHHMDLIVLSWSQSPSPERALVVRGVLEGSSRPVLLLPVTSSDDTSASDATAVQGAIALVRG